MGGEYRRRIRARQLCQQLRLRILVQRRGDLVQQQKARGGKHRAGDGKALALSRGKTAPLFAQDGFKAVGQVADKAALRPIQHLPKGGVIRLGLCQQQIFANTAGKEPGRLWDIAEQSPHGSGAWNVPSLCFQIYPALLRVVQPQNKAEKRAFSAPGHSREAGPAIERQPRGKIPQNRLFLALIGKGDIFKYDGAKDVVLLRRLSRRLPGQGIQLIQPRLRRADGCQPGLNARQARERALEHREEL